MRKRIFNIILLCLTFCIMISVTFGWWIEGVISDSFIIKSANISSEITLYKGIDFNLDGNLDKLENPFELVTPASEDDSTLVLDFGTIVPTEVHTWKVTVENNGDAAGYVYATLWSEISTKLTNEQKNIIKYMSIKIMGAADGTKVYLGAALANTTSKTVLFGGTDSDIVDIGKTKEYVFQIQVETFADLVEAGVCSNTDEEKQAYQALQGKITADGASFEFLDVSLSSAKPQ